MLGVSLMIIGAVIGFKIAVNDRLRYRNGVAVVDKIIETEAAKGKGAIEHAFAILGNIGFLIIDCAIAVGLSPSLLIYAGCTWRWQKR